MYSAYVLFSILVKYCNCFCLCAVAHEPSKRNGLRLWRFQSVRWILVNAVKNTEKSILKHNMQSRNQMITKGNRNTNERKMDLFTTAFGLDALW